MLFLCCRHRYIHEELSSFYPFFVFPCYYYFLKSLSISLNGNKVYYSVVRDKVWHCIKRSGHVQKMYECCDTAVKCAVAVTEEFKLKLGLMIISAEGG